MLDHFYYPVETKIWGRLVLDTVSLEVFEVAECARSSMDRASDFGSEGWGFKSLRAHHSIPEKTQAEITEVSVAYI